MNGRRQAVSPSTVTWRSCMASSRLDCITAKLARLIVAEQDLMKDRGRVETQTLAFLVVVIDAGHVAGQQVRCELDAGEGAVYAAGERFGQCGFTDTGDVFQKDMPITMQGGRRYARRLRVCRR